MLATLQSWLTDFYALELGYDVEDFLITDQRIANALDRGGRTSDEKLLIAEEDGEAEVCLYLEQGLLERLAEHDPTARLDQHNLADFWTALEGVSHFTYYAFKAAHDRPVTLLEMELQAEVDKFVATAMLLRRQGGAPPSGLHRWLFDLPRLAAELSPAEQERYERANHYAGKYCMRLWPRLARGSGGERLREELCYFYRLARGGKIEHIEAQRAH
jgi:hypothetical protein